MENQDSNETESGEEMELTDSVENQYGDTAVTEKEFHEDMIPIGEDYFQSNKTKEEDPSSFEVKDKPNPISSYEDYGTVEASGVLDEAYFEEEEDEDDIGDEEHIFPKEDSSLKEVKPTFIEEETSLVEEEIILTEGESITDYPDYNMMSGFK